MNTSPVGKEFADLKWIRLSSAMDLLWQRKGVEESSLLSLAIPAKDRPEQERQDLALLHQREIQSELNSILSNAAHRSQVKFRGVAIKSRNEHESTGLEDIPSEYFRMVRCFEGSRNSIEPAFDTQVSSDWLASRYLGERHPKWIDVIVDERRFHLWLDEVAPLKPLSDQDAERLYREYVDFSSQKPSPPGRTEDVTYMQSRGVISGDRVRALRREFAPHDWHEGGTPKKYRKPRLESNKVKN
jgi:hypothetical protein